MKHLLYLSIIVSVAFAACKKDDNPTPEPIVKQDDDNTERCKLSKITYSAWFPFKPYDEMANTFAPKKLAIDASWEEINPNVFKKLHDTLENVDTIVVYNEYGDIISFEYNDKYGTGERIEYEFDYSLKVNGKTYRRLIKQTNFYFIPTFHKKNYNFHYTGAKLDSITTGFGMTESTVLRYTYLSDNLRSLEHRYYGWFTTEDYTAVEHLDKFGRVTKLGIKNATSGLTIAHINYTYKCD